MCFQESDFRGQTSPPMVIQGCRQSRCSYTLGQGIDLVHIIIHIIIYIIIHKIIYFSVLELILCSIHYMLRMNMMHQWWHVVIFVYSRCLGVSVWDLKINKKK